MGIKKDIDELKKSMLEKEEVEKPFKLPFGKKVGKAQKSKGFVTVLLLQENGTYDFKKYQIDEQTIVHDLIPRLATAGHVMFDKKGNPLIILPNWSVEPFSPLEHYDQTMISGANTKGYKILMSKMLSEQTNKKKEMGNIVKWVLSLGLIAIVGWAFMSGA